MILVDTSAWIHWLRTDGDTDTRNRVSALLQNGDAAWCPMVKLELWNGAGGNREKKLLRQFEQTLHLLPIDQPVWQQADELAQTCRGNGISMPSTDLLIAACAIHHGCRIESTDSDFLLIERATSIGLTA